MAERPEPFDPVVIGSGTTGLGMSVDAAARGFTGAVFEVKDFAKGMSSRATKLVHGGACYLAQGGIGLVLETLLERTILPGNASHLASPLTPPQFLYQGS